MFFEKKKLARPSVTSPVKTRRTVIIFLPPVLFPHERVTRPPRFNNKRISTRPARRTVGTLTAVGGARARVRAAKRIREPLVRFQSVSRPFRARRIHRGRSPTTAGCPDGNVRVLFPQRRTLSRLRAISTVPGSFFSQKSPVRPNGKNTRDVIAKKSCVLFTGIRDGRHIFPNNSRTTDDSDGYRRILTSLDAPKENSLRLFRFSKVFSTNDCFVIRLLNRRFLYARLCSNCLKTFCYRRSSITSNTIQYFTNPFQKLCWKTLQRNIRYMALSL